MSKPVHPATVHFPIAFLSLGYGLDIISAIRPQLPAAASNLLPLNADLTRASYYLLSLGLITLVPAIMSGGAQAVKMIQRQGMYEADGKTPKQKVKAVIAHAVVNDIVAAASAYVWWCKRAAAQGSIAGKLGVGSMGTDAATYTPASWMVVAQVVMLGLLLFGASIGGALTYNYGVGFAPMSSGKKSQ